MPSAAPSNESNHSTSVFSSRGKVLSLALALAVVIGAAWLIMANSNDSPAADSNGTKSTVAQTKPYNATEAVKSATLLYSSYLPLKTQTVAEVGDNQNVEPAAVQVIRASEIYFTPKFYDAILADYMTEYQATGAVTKDDVACVSNTTDTYTAALASKSGDSAVVNVTLTLSDGSTKLIPVTFDLHTLKASKIVCTP